jgi:chemotaxis receptor (MCP) glutamine deamidase CheD/CheY-like chemotaxis protein
MDQQFLLPGDLVTTRKPMRLATLLGSCVSVCLSNPFRRLAGMNHYMLPELVAGGEIGRYGDASTAAMIKALFALDADPKHYRAHVYGGGRVIGHLGALGDIGARNIEVARRLLQERGIAIEHADVGGSRGRRIDFNTDTGSVDCRAVGGSAPSPAQQPRTRVLIVDDSAITRRMLRRGLESCGDIVVVGEAGDAFQARDQVLTLDPDVLTLDVEMPQVDGMTFLRQLMKHFPKPVIVLSSLTTPGSELTQRARAVGAFEVLDKLCFDASGGETSVARVLAPIVRRAASVRSQ